MSIDRPLTYRLLFGLAAVLTATLLWLPAMAQDPGYHQFADQRRLLGISNMWNVTSNLPFIVIGLYGLRVVNGQAVADPTRRTLARLFFLGLMLTGCGSVYYHLAPGNETLFWDRLPMTLCFTSFFSLLLSLHVGLAAARRLWLPLLALGFLSVIYWRYTESLGQGDLRAYLAIQTLPILFTPLMLLLLPSRHYPHGFTWLILVCYLSAKLAETFDQQLFQLLDFSGHSLKHLLASLSGLLMLRLIRYCG